jgi:hypothetical protein
MASEPIHLLDLPESILHHICSFLNPKPDLLYGVSRSCHVSQFELRAYVGWVVTFV